MKAFVLLFSIVLLSSTKIIGQQSNVFPIWEKTMPNYQESDEKEIIGNKKHLWLRKVQKPTIEVFLPPQGVRSEKAVIIFPGGGYYGLSYEWEGTFVAKWLNSKGISAFVLKYRLPAAASIIEKHKAPLQDAQRGIRWIRANASKYNIDPEQIGVLGFSAGGNLASNLGVHYNDKMYKPTDAIDTLSAKPNFIGLIYPVISMSASYTHKGSTRNLLGDKPSNKLKEFFSSELHVTKNTSPTFLVHSQDDKIVSALNSIEFYKKLIQNDVPSEMHIYPKGGHGYSLGLHKGNHESWGNLFIDWLEALEKKETPK